MRSGSIGPVSVLFFSSYSALSISPDAYRLSRLSLVDSAPLTRRRSRPQQPKPLIIIVPIVLGWVPAHQSAVIAVLWSALVSPFVYRTLGWRDYPRVLRRMTELMVVRGRIQKESILLYFLYLFGVVSVAVVTTRPSRCTASP